MPRVVIIGSSVSGAQLAFNLRDKAADSDVTLISQENYLPYDKRKLPFFLNGSLKEEDLYLFSEKDLNDKGINFLRENKVISVNPKRNTVSSKDRQALVYDVLVIASGVSAFIPDIPGAKKDGVFDLCSLDDFKKLSKYYIGEQVCVFGSNTAAVNLAESITQKYKVEVKLINSLPFEGSVANPQIEVLNLEPQEIIGEGQVQAVKFTSGKVISACAVIFMDKFEGNTAFLKDSPLVLENKFIVVDDEFRTNLENVFACGAACIRTGEPGRMKTWDECAQESLKTAESIIKNMRG